MDAFSYDLVGAVELIFRGDRVEGFMTGFQTHVLLFELL